MFEKTWGMPNSNQIIYADELSNGDYVLIGVCTLWADAISNGPYQFYMSKIDKSGNILWEKNYGDPDGEDFFGSVTKTKEGTYVIIGTIMAGSYDPHVLNLDSDGNIVFDQYYTVGGGFNDGGSSICETLDSGFIIACWLNILPMGHDSPTLIKIDAMGNEIWRKRQDSLVDYYPEVIRSLPDSGFIVLGNTNVSLYYNSYIAKYNSSGNMQWIKYPYGINSTPSNYQAGLIINNDNSFEIPYSVMDTQISQNTTQWKKFDSNGNFISDFTFDYYLSLGGHTTTVPSYNEENSMYISTSPPFAYCGQWIMEIDNNKNVFYRARITDADSTAKYLFYTIRTSDGGYLSVGGFDKASDNLHSQFYIVKFAPDGRYQPDDFSESINAYPNPSMDRNVTLTFDMTKDDNVQVDIFSTEGKLVYTNSIFCPANSHTELPVRLDEISANGGMYILQARTSDAIYRKKLIVMRQK